MPTAPLSNKPWRAWVYAYPPEESDKQEFEDEDGYITEIPTKKGGEIILGKNGDIPVGAVVGQVALYYVHDIYKYYEEMKKIK